MKRSKHRVRFSNADMDFNLTWALGVSDLMGWSHGEVFFAAGQIKDGDGASWCEAFRVEGAFLRDRAVAELAAGRAVSAGQSYLGSCFAYRTSLQYADPGQPQFGETIACMEAVFREGTKALSIPVRPVEVPFEQASLPGYYLEIDACPRPTLIMVGGGDTFREDLFYFAGYPGWKRDYNVLMVDIPGQGKTPDRGLHFRIDAESSIGAVLDWLEANASCRTEDIAVYGVSGGGYFTARAVASDQRIKAWIASTPIYDMAELFRVEFGSALRAPAWISNMVGYLVGHLNANLAINLKKYAWQFGTSDFAKAAKAVVIQAPVVDVETIRLPSLFLVGESESDELKRQAREIYRVLVSYGVDVELREFTGADGADAHCQVNNLRLAHVTVFDWLDRVFDRGPAPARLDPRLLC